ncbi:MAG: energy-coupling factor transporter transmembrane protein EcfT [Synechococcales cyanobacterium K44_A2020_017]|nr:energy-coupling factor transporter transmembrane protein EcfT [Synechococcales cyanobacterium K32_A2020_035]MBF2095613.1 energy-coupling factor transporter transmembrane protein EcfT [Synechococcales cyanobacterium K44_A2020_017]
MALGLYVPKRSPIHALPAGMKVLGLAIAGMGLFFVQDWLILLGTVGLVVILMAIAHLPGRSIWQQLRPLVVIVLAIVALHGVLTSWQVGLAIALRLLALVGLAIVVSSTTKVSDMLALLERWLSPLRYIGINPGQVSLVIAIAIRFIPVLLEQLQAIQEAQQARGCDRHPVRLLVPLLIRMLYLARDLTDALEARGYDPQDPAESSSLEKGDR